MSEKVRAIGVGNSLLITAVLVAGIARLFEGRTTESCSLLCFTNYEAHTIVLALGALLLVIAAGIASLVELVGKRWAQGVSGLLLAPIVAYCMFLYWLFA